MARLKKAAVNLLLMHVQVEQLQKELQDAKKNDEKAAE